MSDIMLVPKIARPSKLESNINVISRADFNNHVSEIAVVCKRKCGEIRHSPLEIGDVIVLAHIAFGC